MLQTMNTNDICTQCGLSPTESGAPLATDGRCLLCWGKNDLRNETDYIWLIGYHIRQLLDDWQSLSEEEKEYCVHEVAQGVASCTYLDRPFVARFKNLKCPCCTYTHYSADCAETHARVLHAESEARQAAYNKKLSKIHVADKNEEMAAKLAKLNDAQRAALLQAMIVQASKKNPNTGRRL